MLWVLIRLPNLIRIGVTLGVLFLVACGPAATGSATTPSTSQNTPAAAAADTPTAAAAGPAGEVSEDLTFTGALAGHLTKAHRGDTYVCAGGNFASNNPNTTGQ